jgi:signal transduction histidine kinase
MIADMTLASRFLRPRTLLALLTLGASLLVAFAAWETSRSRRIAERVMQDYAAIIADKLVDGAARRYRSAVGLGAAEDGLAEVRLGALLRAHARAMGEGQTANISIPEVIGMRYAFVYDASKGRLATSSPIQSVEERERLSALLRDVRIDCGASCQYAFGRLTQLLPTAAPDEIDWGGVIDTDERGQVRWVYGVRLDPAAAVQRFVVPLILDARDCRCPAALLPTSLAGFTDTRAAASFVVRDRDGRTLYRSEPHYGSEITARVELPNEIPLANVTVEVAVNPAVVRPLLPYGGRGTPWLLLAAISGMVLGSALLAWRAFRRESDLARARQTFISNVSHELKTPLARIRLFNDLLSAQRQGSAEKQAHYRAVVDRECRRLTLLIDNVLQFARLERVPDAYEMRPVALGEVVERAVDTFQATSGEHRLALSVDLGQVPPVRGDAPALEQVVVNLLDNAVKYSPAGAPIDVRLSATAGAAELRVRDRGCGVPEQERERIFDEFYRVQSGDSQRIAGNGLGLAIVRRVVRACGGDVSVESAVDMGSTFIVRLPLWNVEIDRAAGSQA